MLAPPGGHRARFVREISLWHGRVRVGIDHAAEHGMGVKLCIINQIEGLPGKVSVRAPVGGGELTVRSGRTFPSG